MGLSQILVSLLLGLIVSAVLPAPLYFALLELLTDLPSFLQRHPLAAFFVLIFSVLALLSCWFYLRLRECTTGLGIKLACIYGLLFVLGISLGFFRLHQQTLGLEFETGKTTLVELEVRSVAQQAERTRLEARLQRYFENGAWHRAKDQTIRLDWYASAFATQQIAVCSHWQMRLVFKPLRSVANPGQASQALALLSKHIVAKALVKEGLLIAPVRESFVKQAYCNLMQQRQDWIARFIKAFAHLPTHAYLLAILLGDKSQLSMQQWHWLQSSGTVHLFVVSGLHIAFVASLMWLLATLIVRSILWVRPKYECANEPNHESDLKQVFYHPQTWQRYCIGWPSLCFVAVASLIAALAYALLSGFAIPAQRAVLMLCCLYLGRLIGAQWPWLFALLFTLLLILIRQPLAIFSLSLQLSFMAVLVLLLLNKTRNIARQDESDLQTGKLIDEQATEPQSLKPFVLLKAKVTYKQALALLRLQVGLSLVMACLLSSQGQNLTLAVIVINAILVPLFGTLVLPLVLLSFISWVLLPQDLWLSTWVASLFAVVDWLISTLFAMAERLSVWFAMPLVPVNGAGQLLLVLFVCLALLLPLRQMRLLALGLIGMFYYSAQFEPSAMQFDYGEFGVAQFDVGQGQAVMIKTQHHTLLYDTGFANDRFSYADWVLLPSMQALGIKQLDALLISHSDQDHSGGLLTVFGSMPVKQLYLGQSLSTREQLAVQSGPNALEPEFCHQQAFTWDGVEFVFIALDTSRYRAIDNNTSCVLLVRSGVVQKSALFLGDIHKDKEQELVKALDKMFANAQADTQVNLVTVAHHGSQSSSSQVLLRRLAADYGLISAAYRHRYGHPHKQVVKRWQAAGTKLLNSAQLGFVLVSFRQSQEASIFSQRQSSWAYRPWFWSRIDQYD